MTLVVIDSRGRCTIADGKPGAYDAETARDGTITLVPLVRATDRKSPTIVAPRPTKGPKRLRDRKDRSWAKIPYGTVLDGPPEVGKVVMGMNGRLQDGRTPNEAFTDAGLTRNAWQYLILEDGREVRDAYDDGDFA